MQTAQPAPIPSADLINAALAVFIARAAAETLKPVVEKIQIDILIKHEFIYVDPFAHRAENPVEAAKPQRLVSFDRASDLHLVGDGSFERLFAILEQEYVNAGFAEGREPGQCPLLIARSLERQATGEFVRLSQEINPAFDVQKIENISHEKYQEYVELMLRYVGKFVDKEDTEKIFKEPA